MIAYTPDGRHLLVGSPDGRVKIWDLASKTRIWNEILFNDFVLDLVVAADGRSWVALGRDAEVSVFRGFPGELHKKLDTTCDRIHSLALSHTTSQLVLGCADGLLPFLPAVSCWPWAAPKQ